MTEFLFNTANFWFSIAIGIVLIMFVIELVGLFFGVSLISFSNELTGLDIDAEADMGGDKLFAIASWLSLEKLPLSVWLVMFLSFFGLCGYLINYLAASMSSWALPGWASVPVSAVVAIVITGRLGNTVGRLLPYDESAALDSDEFIGAAAIITLGKATSGNPAEAKFTDRFSQPHYMMVEPLDTTEAFSQGDKVILVKRGPRGWMAMRYK